jgi:type II secretory pathway component PulF
MLALVDGILNFLDSFCDVGSMLVIAFVIFFAFFVELYNVWQLRHQNF